MYTYLWLISWDLITYLWTLGKTAASLSSHCAACSLLYRVRFLWTSPINIGMSTNIAVFPPLFRKPFWEQFGWHIQKTLLCSTHLCPLALTIFPFPLLQCSLSLRCGGCRVDMKTEPGLPVFIHSLHFDQFYQSLKKNDSLMKGESYTSLWIWGHVS